MKKEANKKFGNFEVVFLIIVTCIISLLIGYFLSGKKEGKTNDEVLNEFIKTYNEITIKYDGKIDKKELLNGAVSGMLNTLDQHSALIDQDEDENFYLMLDGSYKGIGIEVAAYEDKIIVIGVIESSPASKAGIQIGDILKKIDDLDMKGKTTRDVVSYIRKNTEKDEFNITVDRDGEELTFTTKRDNVVIPSVVSHVIEQDEKRIGYIYISVFSNTTSSQFAKKLEELRNEEIDGLIIDIRENNGGHLTTAINIISMLTSKKKVIYQMNKDGKKSKFYSVGDEDFDLPLVILQNRNSASAAEMLSVSLKENLKALVVGEKSYGKGTVQEYSYLSTGDMYKYTTKKWLSPKGKSIDGVGVKPDVEVSLDDNYKENPSDETDNQLQTAVQEMLDTINK